MRARDTTAEADTVQLEIYRRMTPEARLRAGLELTEISRRLLITGIRQRHPEYDANQVRLAAIRVWLGPGLFREAYPREPELAP
jgi:hypothetical protein